MEKFDTKDYLNSLYKNLLNNCKIQKIELTRAWASNFPSTPGVYIFLDNKKIIYVGERGNLRGRMKDMIDTRSHVLRRSLGKKLYSEIEGFEAASAKKKFTAIIEKICSTRTYKKILLSVASCKLGPKRAGRKNTR